MNDITIVTSQLGSGASSGNQTTIIGYKVFRVIVRAGYHNNLGPIVTVVTVRRLYFS